MNLTSLKITNYKNISATSIELPAKINCLVGNNGTGKTNFLDSIYFLAFTRSYFNHIDNQNIKHNEEFFRLEGTFNKHDSKSSVKTTFSSKGKIVKLNDKKHKKLSNHFGLFPVVMITPYDIDLIMDGSEVRRNFMDSIISQYDRDYLNELINYKKALQQRNSLLKSFAENRVFDQEMLELWDYKIVKICPVIFEKRKTFLDKFVPIFDYYYKIISGTEENVSIEYKSDLYSNKIEIILSENVQKDLILQRTTRGIHKDDLLFKIDEFQLKKIASQGQQKTFVTALKFAQSNFIKEKTGFKPILLLDDVFDKLDTQRVENVVNLVSDDHFGQIFITHTDKEKLEQILTPANVDYSIINVDAGKFTTFPLNKGG